jgi:hypothetical protein
MVVLIFFLAFSSILLYFFEKLKSKNVGIFTCLRLSFVYTLVLGAFISYFFCEIFSIFNVLDLVHLAVGWLLIFMVFATLLIKSGVKFEISIPHLPSIHVVYSLIIFIIILLPLLILTVFIPPNNWDSMSYHMTRVEEWRQNLNVYPFPTSNIRQVNYPPLAEYIILNLQVLSQSDYFANLVQYFSLLGSLSLISLSVKSLGLDFRGQFLSVLLLLSIPMVIFQSTSTQTDLTASFFLLGVIYSVFKILKSHLICFQDIILLGAFLFLGGLVKYTVFVFSAPFLIVVAYHIIKHASFRAICQYAIICVFYVAIIFGPFLSRNLAYFGNLTGETGLLNLMGNEHPNLFKMLGNVSKNIVDEMTIPWDAFNSILTTWVQVFHEMIGVPLNSQETNYLSMPYQTNFLFAEDNASSLIHALIILGSLVFFIFNKKFQGRQKMLLYWGGLIFSFLVYSFLFKWQPWGNRLLLPIFILSMLAVTLALYQVIQKSRLGLHLVFIFFVLYAIPSVYLNRNKPMFDLYQMRSILNKPKGMMTKEEFNDQSEKIKHELLNYYSFNQDVYLINQKLPRVDKEKLFKLQDSLFFFEDEKISIFKKSREENYFINQPYLYPMFTSIFRDIPQNKNRLALYISGDAYEYPLWVFARKKFGNNFKMGHPNYNYKWKTRNHFLANEQDVKISEIKNKWLVK